MTDQELIKTLLESVEGPTLDFKSAPYRLDNEHYKSMFIKDIISMANTPREGSSFILIGVSLHQDGNKEVKGISDHPDDANLQQLLIGQVRPIPSFHYRPVEYKGINLGLIEVYAKKSGPYIPIKSYKETLRMDVIYFRRGSSNDIAKAEDLKLIVAWMDRGDMARDVNQEPVSSGQSSWDLFFDACERFSSGYQYVLALNGDGLAGTNQLSSLGRVNWGMVLDFDPSSDTSGIFSSVKSELETSRGTHILTLKQRVALNPNRGTYWIAASGLSNEPSSLCSSDWRSWYLKYASDLNSLAAEFVKASSERPILVVTLLDDPEFIRSVANAFLGSGGESIKFVFGSKKLPGLDMLAQTFHAKPVRISFPEVCGGLSIAITRRAQGNQMVFPSWEGEKVIVPLDKIPWLEENLEFIKVGESPTNDRQDFLRGRPISWDGLELHFDIDRDKTDLIQKRIERDLSDRSIRIHCLYHWPGSGGSTVARRVAFNLRNKFPVVIISKFNLPYLIPRPFQVEGWSSPCIHISLLKMQGKRSLK